jgi:hypothetical protein
LTEWSLRSTDQSVTSSMAPVIGSTATRDACRPLGTAVTCALRAFGSAATEIVAAARRHAKRRATSQTRRATIPGLQWWLTDMDAHPTQEPIGQRDPENDRGRRKTCLAPAADLIWLAGATQSQVTV